MNTIVTYFDHFKTLDFIQKLTTNPRGDVLAGVTVAMVVLPMALAFGVASGLGPLAGMWSAVAAGIIAGPLSGSPWSVGGPTGPITLQILAITQTHHLENGAPDLSFILTTVFLAGVILLVLGIGKMGQFIKFTPYSVISGFMTGLGLLYMLLQLNPFLGLPGASSLSKAIVELPVVLMKADLAAVAVGCLTLAIVMVWPRLSFMTWIPGPLVGLLVGTAVASLFGWDIPKIGDIPSGHFQVSLPDVSVLEAAFVPAATLAGLCMFDSLLTCLIVDNLTGTHHNSDQELVGQGLGNCFAGLVGGMGSATNTMPCVVNIHSGAKSRLSTIVMGVVMLSFIFGLAPLVSAVPLAALAGILLKAGYDILDMRVLPVVRQLPKSDLLVFALVVVMTVFWNLLSAMVVGLAVAFFRFVKDMADRYKVDLDRRAEDVQHEEDDLLFAMAREYAKERRPEGVGLGEFSGRIEQTSRDRILIVRPHGPLFFGAIDWLNETVAHFANKDVLLIRAQWLDELDLSGAYALGDLIEAANTKGVEVLVAGLSPRSKQMLDDLQELRRIKPEHLYSHFTEALAQAIQIVQTKAVAHDDQSPVQPV